MKRFGVWARGLARASKKYLGALLLLSTWDFTWSFLRGFWIWLVASPDNLAAFGTTLSALVALALAALTLRTTQREIKRERMEKEPNLIFIDAMATQFFLGVDPLGITVSQFRTRLEVANLSSETVFLTEIELLYRDPYSAYSRQLKVIMPSGEKYQNTIDLTLPIDATGSELGVYGGKLNLYFYYAPTGKIHHRIFMPYTMKIGADARSGAPEGTIKFYTENQGWESDVYLPSKVFNTLEGTPA